MLPETILKYLLIDKAKSIEFSSILKIDEIEEVTITCCGRETIVRTPIEIECDETASLSFNAEIPDKGSLYLYMPGDYDAILYVDGQRYVGLDRFGREIPLVGLGPGKHLFEIKIHPRLCLGEHHRKPRIEAIYIFAADPEIRLLGREIRWAVELATALSDNDIKKEILEGVAKILRGIDLPVPTPEALLLGLDKRYPSIYTMLYDEIKILGSEKPEILRDAGFNGLEGVKREDLVRAREKLHRLMKTIRRKYHVPGRLYAVEHAHIDASWLWSPSETKWKVERTFSKIVRDLTDNEWMVFVASSALYYRWLEEKPDLWNKVREFIRARRIIPVGGMWIEPDTMIAPPETLARQFLYGQQYFEEELGGRTRIGWLPDSFGYSGNLPQLLREADIEVFMIHKVEWNKYTKIPYTMFVWEGIDGSTIPVHIMIGTYEHRVTPESIINTWRNHRQKNIVPAAIYPYGHGNGGGGATLEMIEKIRFYTEYGAGIPEIIHGDISELAKKILREKQKLPKYSGELYLELHRGTYTTNSRIKTLVWRAEYMVRTAETIESVKSIMGGKYRYDLFRSLWESVLLSTFHDILPGSFTHEAFNKIADILKKIIADSEHIIREDLLESGQETVILNPCQYTRREIVEVNLSRDKLPENTVVQPLKNGKNLVEVEVKGFSTKDLGSAIVRGTNNGKVKACCLSDKCIMENEDLRLEIGVDGMIYAIVDKATGYNYVSSPSPIIAVHNDYPHAWEAWDVDYDAILDRRPLKPAFIKIEEEGPLRACIVLGYVYGRSRIIDKIYLYRGSNRIDHEISFDWRHRRRLVKSWIRTNIVSTKAYYDTPFGVVERPCTMNNEWEAARFEVPMLSWMAYEDGDRGIAIISPTRHGITCIDHEIGVSLLKSPMYPDPLSDYGETMVSYTIMPYKGSWRTAKIYVEAIKTFNPLLRFRGKPKEILGEGLLEISPDNIVFLSVKKAEKEDNAYVLRLYETTGCRGRMKIKFNIPRRIMEAIRTNILELKEGEKLVVRDNTVYYNYKPLEIITLKIVFE